MANAIATEKQQMEEKAKLAVEKAQQRNVKDIVKSAMEVRRQSAVPLYLGLTAGSIILSLFLFLRKQKAESTFVGLWAPTFMGLGLLSKLSDLSHKTSES